jgi:hypothetical protein
MARKPAAAQEPNRAGDGGPPPDDEPRQVTVAFSIAEPLHYAVKMRAVQERTTVKAVVLRALKLAGFDVPEDELVDRRAGRAGRPKGR